jgi:hypothetical protein
MEIWIDIKNYNGDYQISNYGNVKSLKGKPKILKYGYCNSKYKKVSLCKNNECKSFMIHKLVYENFNDIILTGKHIIIDHIDNNKNNNNLDNLQLITQRENSFKDRISKSNHFNIYLNNSSYIVRMRINGSKKTFGTFKNINDAIKKRDEIIEIQNKRLHLANIVS